MTRREVWNLMFLPGFSTCRDVSSLSGRGVGLDIVKTNVQRLSGLIDVDSEPGAGTRFTISLPMTLAILQAVVVKCAGRVYALPFAGVLEVVSLNADDVVTVEGREMLTLRDQQLPLLRLDRMLHPTDAHRGAMPEHASAVIVGFVQHRAALLVDDVVGQQDIVTKSIGAYLGRVRGVAGAAHLGDHELILVLDLAALMEELLQSDGARLQAPEVAAAAAQHKPSAEV
jgi:two-component system chemotaxis sensor kinase CheA